MRKMAEIGGEAYWKTVYRSKTIWVEGNNDTVAVVTAHTSKWLALLYLFGEKNAQNYMMVMKSA